MERKRDGGERKLGRERKTLTETGMGERGEATERERERERERGRQGWERQGRGRNPAWGQSHVGAIPCSPKILYARRSIDLKDMHS